MEILGSVDRCDQTAVEGWISMVGSPETKFELEFLLDGSSIGSCVADRFREDLKDAGIADGKCAFSFDTPAFIPKSKLQSIVVRLVGSQLAILSSAAGEPATNSQGTHSRFGGLWIDRHDWLDRLADKHRKGVLSEDLSLAIFRFVRDGYLIIPAAAAADLVDDLNEEIEQFWQTPPRGLVIETFEPDGYMRLAPPDIALRGGRTKMLDLYAFSDKARSAIASPSVVDFLTAIFAEQPKAFQSLTFWNGSEQAIHKDTAYVKIDSNPMHLVATWLALEDILPGTGELEYYIGSHRAPDFLFGGHSKWMEGYVADHSNFLRSLHEDAHKFDQKRSSFLAKKGDILIWHADLAHGGSAIRRRGHTRKSLVTHFTCDSDEPFYRRKASHANLVVGKCNFISQYCDVISR